MFQTHYLFEPILFSIHALFFNYLCLEIEITEPNIEINIENIEKLIKIRHKFSLNPYNRTHGSHFLWDPMISCGLNPKIQQAKVCLSLVPSKGCQDGKVGVKYQQLYLKLPSRNKQKW